MANCLVVGGNGFIGAPLVDALANAGHQVAAFDRFSGGITKYKHPSVEQISGDYQNLADLADAVAGREYVFHFLSTTTPAAADADPTIDIRTNLSQSVELLRLSAESKVSRFFFASSGGSIYGEQSKTRLSETDPTNPVSPYAIGKLAVEKYMDYFAAKRGLDVVSLRISNPYGPGQKPGARQGLIPIALAHVRDGIPVTRLGAGTMTRDYMYVDDLVRKIVRVASKQPTHTVYNLGSGVGHSVNDVINVIQKVVGRKIDIEIRPKPLTFIEHSVLDVSRYNSEFGVPNDLGLFEGVKRTWLEMTP